MRTMTKKAQQEIEEMWHLRQEAVQILGVVVAEWKSDPMSVQCFDSRTVLRGCEVVKRLGALEQEHKTF